MLIIFRDGGGTFFFFKNFPYECFKKPEGFHIVHAFLFYRQKMS